ncbi:MAG: hypothetical protein ITG00_01555 [Flavobacterium sp.]|nr:hypothetical protein [Flavobacterium sp.]
MSVENFHGLIRSKKLFILFTWFTRILLALGFIPSGLKKVMGMRFTSIGIDNPVGFFFEALYQTGFYWNFLGILQLLAAVLLLIPKTSLLGAILYFPIILNICVIVTAMNFIGTPIITALMLIGNLYLFFWDYPKMKYIANIIWHKSAPVKL